MSQLGNVNFEVRQANESDLDKIVPLFDSYRQFYGQATDLDGCRRFLTARFHESDSIILFASIDNNAIGFVQLFPSHSSVAMRRVWILNDLFVAPSARGSGVATALIKRAEQFCRSTRAVRMMLATANDNAPARRLYERNGWEQEQIFVQYKRNL